MDKRSEIRPKKHYIHILFGGFRRPLSSVWMLWPCWSWARTCVHPWIACWIASLRQRFLPDSKNDNVNGILRLRTFTFFSFFVSFVLWWLSTAFDTFLALFTCLCRSFWKSFASHTYTRQMKRCYVCHHSAQAALPLLWWQSPSDTTPLASPTLTRRTLRQAQNLFQEAFLEFFDVSWGFVGVDLPELLPNHHPSSPPIQLYHFQRSKKMINLFGTKYFNCDKIRN